MPAASSQDPPEAFSFFHYKVFLLCLRWCLCQMKRWWPTFLLWINSLCCSHFGGLHILPPLEKWGCLFEMAHWIVLSWQKCLYLREVVRCSRKSTVVLMTLMMPWLGSGKYRAAVGKGTGPAMVQVLALPLLSCVNLASYLTNLYHSFLTYWNIGDLILAPASLGNWKGYMRQPM